MPHRLQRKAIVPSDNNSLTPVCEWINNNLNKNIGWKELTEISGYSTIILTKLFILHLHTTPMQYIRQQKSVPKTAASLTQDKSDRSELFKSLKK